MELTKIVHDSLPVGSQTVQHDEEKKARAEAAMVNCVLLLLLVHLLHITIKNMSPSPVSYPQKYLQSNISDNKNSTSSTQLPPCTLQASKDTR
ncbi:hypothetical protein EAE99_008561 [Botrytis elliptica]|nr:hypothetical protein EAE99_008561 [Botrytis elliptica]